MPTCSSYSGLPISVKCNSKSPVCPGHSPDFSHSSHPAHNHDDEDGDSHDGNNNDIRTNTESYARHGSMCFYTGLHVKSPIIGTYYPYFTEGKLRLRDLPPSHMQELYHQNVYVPNRSTSHRLHQKAPV